MANFNTHLVVGAGGSVALATSCLGAGIATPQEALLYFCAGTLGGLLPDLDSDKSTILDIVFTTLSVMTAFVVVFSKITNYAIIEQLFLGIVVYLFMQKIMVLIFKKQTKHRGLFHSVPAGIVAGLLTVSVVYHLFHWSNIVSWMTGCFMCAGYLIHLTLDEIYSVDLLNKKIKRSFGTAFKFFDSKNLAMSVMLYIVIFVLFNFAPAYDTFLNTVFTYEVYLNFKNNFFPKGNEWFIK